MQQWLVMVSGSFDDVPLQLFDSPEEAGRYARLLRDEAVLYSQLRSLGVECSERWVEFISVYAFVDGAAIHGSKLQYAVNEDDEC